MPFQLFSWSLTLFIISINIVTVVVVIIINPCLQIQIALRLWNTGFYIDGQLKKILAELPFFKKPN